MTKEKPNATRIDREANQDKSKEVNQPLAEKLKDLATAAGAISAAVGIIFSSYTYVTTQWSKNDEAQRAQLSTFSTYGQYLKNYQTYIQPALGRLMNDPERLRLDVAMRRKETGVCSDIINRANTKTGFQVFMSPSLKDARYVHNYYESVGYGLAQGQLDFEVIFDLITLPAYWNIQDPSSDWYKKRRDINSTDNISLTYLYPDFSVLLPWRSCLGSGYFGLNKPLSDFSDGVDRLGFNYLFARAKYLYNRSCQHGKPLQDNAFIVPDGNKESSSKNIPEACIILRARIREMALANGKPKTWLKLYQGNYFDIDPNITLFGRSFRFPWNNQ
jgi:hypothetical protein